MPKILIKLPRYTDVNGHKKIVSKGGEWYIKDPSQTFHTEFGQVPVDVLQKIGKHTIDKDEYCVIPADSIDKYRQLKQNVQKITLKDLGFISSYVGIDDETIVAEAGTGSGGATAYFGGLALEVHSMDIREDASTHAQKELDKLGLKDVTFYTLDICNPDQRPPHFPEGIIDVFLLDVPEPWRAWENMQKAVRIGGWVVGYTPNANQLQQFVNTAPDNFMKVHTCEVIERHWRVDGRVCRPETADHSHTAFLSFFRRIY